MRLSVCVTCQNDTLTALLAYGSAPGDVVSGRGRLNMPSTASGVRQRSSVVFATEIASSGRAIRLRATGQQVLVHLLGHLCYLVLMNSFFSHLRKCSHVFLDHSAVHSAAVSERVCKTRRSLGIHL